MDKKKKFKDLRRSLAKTGYILHGTITERVMEKDGKKYGPYYQWTFRRKSKTVTVNLSKEQSIEYSKAIKNHKEVKKTLSEMEKLSLEILEESTKGVKKHRKKALS